MSILSDTSSDELFRFMCGEQLGDGRHRVVYDYQLNPKWVIKQDTRANFSNVHEYTIWNEYRKTDLKKWLAPVHFMSNGGIWLIQSKTKPITMEEMPKEIPAIFCDLKLANWGKLDGRIVCHDYGNHTIYTLARKNMLEMKPAKWMDKP